MLLSGYIWIYDIYASFRIIYHIFGESFKSFQEERCWEEKPTVMKLILN